jgi:hypothetical protein
MKKVILIFTSLLITLSISSQGNKNLVVDIDEMQAINKGHDDYGSTWRQHDLDLVLSNEFKDLLNTDHIILIGWRQIRDLMKGTGSK